MISPLCQVACQVIARRKTLNLTQRQVAHQVSCSQPYIAQIETGRRPVSPAMAQKLEQVFEVEPGTYTNVRFLRGRPPLTDKARRILKTIRKAQPLQTPQNPQHERVPRFPRPDWAKSREDAYFPLREFLSPDQAAPIHRLEEQRYNDEIFWRRANGIRFDSWSEKLLTVNVAEKSTLLTGISWKTLEPALHSSNGITGRSTAHRAYPAFILQQGNLDLLWFNQRCIRTQQGYRWPDNVVVAARDGLRLTTAVEVDGLDYHKDRSKEARRDQELGIPVLHLAAEEAGAPETLNKILNWIEQEFEKRSAGVRGHPIGNCLSNRVEFVQ